MLHGSARRTAEVPAVKSSAAINQLHVLRRRLHLPEFSSPGHADRPVQDVAYSLRLRLLSARAWPTGSQQNSLNNNFNYRKFLCS